MDLPDATDLHKRLRSVESVFDDGRGDEGKERALAGKRASGFLQEDFGSHHCFPLEGNMPTETTHGDETDQNGTGGKEKIGKLKEKTPPATISP